MSKGYNVVNLQCVPLSEGRLSWTAMPVFAVPSDFFVPVIGVTGIAVHALPPCCPVCYVILPKPRDCHVYWRQLSTVGGVSLFPLPFPFASSTLPSSDYDFSFIQSSPPHVDFRWRGIRCTSQCSMPMELGRQPSHLSTLYGTNCIK